jgi:hypothetical protein
MNLLPNSHGSRVRVIQFLPNEIEIDLVVIGFEVDGKRMEPIVLGGLPRERWCFFASSLGDDYSSTTEGRYVLPSGGEMFSNVMDVRVKFGTTYAQTQQAELDAAPMVQPAEVSAAEKHPPCRPGQRL